MPTPINPETEVALKTFDDINRAIKAAKTVLFSNGKEVDALIVRKVSLERDCRRLEAQKQQEITEVGISRKELEDVKGRYIEIKNNILQEENTLKNIHTESASLLEQISVERANIAQERATLETLRKKVNEEQGILTISITENARLAKSNTEHLKRIKEFASLL